MSKPCRRPARAEIREQRRQKKRQEKILRAQRCAGGARPRSPEPLPNGCSTFATIDEERAAREDAVSKQARLLRQELPALLDSWNGFPTRETPGSADTS